jgi:hypothetical protein
VLPIRCPLTARTVPCAYSSVVACFNLFDSLQKNKDDVVPCRECGETKVSSITSAVARGNKNIKSLEIKWIEIIR